MNIVNNNREQWLNGWNRHGSTFIMGTGVYCVGCGRGYGVICVLIPEDYIFPDKEPDFPFNEDNCPICQAAESIISNLSIERLRKEIQKRKLHERYPR